MNCSKEHGRVYQRHENKTNDNPLGVVTLCYYNKDLEFLQQVIKNQITLMICEHHRDQYRYADDIPLSMEAYDASINDLFSQHTHHE